MQIAVRTFFLLFLLTTAAQAAVVERMDIGRLVSTADAIVVGRVLSQESRFEGARIVTRVQVRTQAVLKGQATEIIEVEVLGGEVDGLAQQVSGMAAFTEGEQVALFLERRGTAFRTVGLAQGKLRIEADWTGIRLVQALDGLTLVERNPAGALVPAAALPLSRDLADFLGDLGAALDAAGP